MDLDWLRWVNVVLSSAVSALLIAGAYYRWPVMPARLKRIVPWVIATYVLIAYGSGEAASQHVSPGSRVAFLAVILLGLLVALTYRFDAKDYER